MNPASPGKLLAAWNLSPKHHFGQNFLCNPEITARIAESAAKNSAGTLIEIGAGLGALTSSLLERASRVIAIERDRDLIPVLNDVFRDEVASGQLLILEQDAKSVDYAALFAQHPGPHALAGNLPYQLTGPLLRRACELAASLDRAVFMVQLEVASRLCALPSTPDYGALTVFTQAAYAVQRLFTIKPGAFFPQPRVDSAVVELVPLRPPIAAETELFRELVQSAFQQRRKTLRNAWGHMSVVSPERIAAAAEASAIDLNRRGETLSVLEFARMAQAVTA